MRKQSHCWPITNTEALLRDSTRCEQNNLDLDLRFSARCPRMDVANLLKSLDGIAIQLRPQKAVDAHFCLGAHFSANATASSSIESGAATASTIPSANASFDVHLWASRSILRATSGLSFIRGSAPMPSKCNPRLTGGYAWRSYQHSRHCVVSNVPQGYQGTHHRHKPSITVHHPIIMRQCESTAPPNT